MTCKQVLFGGDQVKNWSRRTLWSQKRMFDEIL